MSLPEVAFQLNKAVLACTRERLQTMPFECLSVVNWCVSSCKVKPSFIQGCFDLGGQLFSTTILEHLPSTFAAQK